MARNVYPWERFWVPREGTLAFDAEGFLRAPPDQRAWRKASKTDVISFPEIDQRQCLILLGEPGIGKSFALQVHSHSGNAVFRNLGTYANEQRLIDEVFGNAPFRRWESHGGELRLFLDSFDECLIRLDNVASLLADRFRSLRTVDGLFVRISSRTAEWRIGLEDALRQKFRDERVGAYELAPLTRDQVCTALRMEGISPEVFVREVLDREVVSFAIKPLTLDLLVRIWKRRGGSLPPNQTEIYEQGCTELCSEANPERDTPQLNRRLTAADRLDVASHIAAATLFCRRSAIFRSERPALAVETDITTPELLQSVIRPGGGSFNIDSRALRETFDTGLFTARGAERLGWAHQTYAEFLAARYVARQELSIRQILDLIEHPADPEQRVVPQLQETAAWIGSMVGGVFDRILLTDPELLLRSDIATRDHATKARLIDALLNQHEVIPRNTDWGRLRARYRKLCHAGIASQLAARLRSRSLGEAAKLTAVDIANSCELRTLLPLLARIAVNTAAPTRLRQAAADVVARTGDTKAKRILRLLALGKRGADKDEDLHGAGLRACWPKFMSARELFQSINKPRDRVTSRYSLFLSYNLVEGLEDGDLPVALKWVLSQPKLGPLDGRAELVGQIMERAARVLKDRCVRKAFVAALLKRLDEHAYSTGTRATALNNVFDADPAVRRKCIKVALDLFRDPSNDAFLITRWGIRLAHPSDLQWLLAKLKREKTTKKRNSISQVIARVFYPDDPAQIDAVIEASKTCRALYRALLHWLKPVGLDSEQAAKARESWQREEEWKRVNAEGNRPKPPLEPPPAEHIRALLVEVEGGNFDQWWRISHWAEAKEDGTYAEKSDRVDLRALPGWQNAIAGDRTRMIAAARLYLLNHTGTAEIWFAKPNRMYRTMTAGLRALVLLVHEDLASFKALDPKVWEQWVPAVVRSSHFDETQEFQTLLARALEVVPEKATAEILLNVDREARKGETLWVLDKLGDEIHQGVGKALLRRLQRTPAVKAKCAVQLLRKCLDAGVPDSLETLRQWLPTNPVRQKRRRLLAIEATYLLLLRGDVSDWPAIRNLISRDSAFGKIPLSRISYERHYVVPPLLTKIAPRELGSLWEWMLIEYPISGDPDRSRGGTVTTRWAMADLRDELIWSLADRGTADACEELERLRTKYPESAQFDRVLTRAKEQTRRNTWNPMSPAQLFALAAERHRRVVQSADQLMDVVRESLEALEAKLHSETPAAQFLWDLDRPKEEEAISDWLKIELDTLLVNRGVIVNREVQIHIRERTDIHVDAVTQAANGIEPKRIKVIIEVKGCWNPDQKRAMERQLLNRYLAQNDCTNGIFLLAWFVCEAWTAMDRRQRAVPFMSKGAARAYFVAQATRLSDPPIRLSSVVLDATISATRKKATDRGATPKNPGSRSRRRNSGQK
jgi:hypothetical protein